MIVGYVGKCGSGKTYSMSNDLIAAMELGQEVWANYALKGAHYFKDLDEILNVEQGIVAVDELNTLMPAARWQSIKMDHLNLFSQSRKGDLDLLYTSQVFARVVAGVRDITNDVWCFDWVFRPRFRRGKEPNAFQRWLYKFHTAKLFDPSQLNHIRAKPREKYTFYENKKIYSYYNTKFRIKTPKYFDELADVRDFDPRQLPKFDDNLTLDETPRYVKESHPLLPDVPQDVRMP